MRLRDKLKAILHSFLAGFLLFGPIVPAFGNERGNEESQFKSGMSEEEFLVISGQSDLVKDNCHFKIDVPNIHRSKPQLNPAIVLELNYRKFSKMVLRKIQQAGVETVEMQGWRKKFKILIGGRGNLCKLEGEARLTGDLLSHLKPDQNIHSLKVKIKNGNMEGFSTFKIFVEGGRRLQEELFVSSLMRAMGFAAPRSFIVPAVFNGIQSTVLIQEDINGEFLESIGFHEGYIFGGDERLGLSLTVSQLSIKNEKRLDFPQLAKVKYKLHSYLNRLYLRSALTDQNFKNALIGNDTRYNEKFPDPMVLPHLFDKQSVREMLDFSVFSASVGALHGLKKDDHRIFYDFISDRYKPIYYDGDPVLVKLKKPVSLPFGFAPVNVANLRTRLQQIDAKSLHETLKSAGSSLTFDEFLANIETIQSNMDYLRPSPDAEVVKIPLSSDDTINKIMAFWRENIRDRKKHTSKNDGYDTGFIRYLGSYDQFEYCLPQEKKYSCKGAASPIVLKKNNHGLSIETVERKLRLIELSIDEGDYTSIDPRVISYPAIPGVEFRLYGDAFVEIDEKERLINFGSGKSGRGFAQVTVSGGVLRDWRIFVGVSSHLGYPKPPAGRASSVGLTGCLTLADLTMQNVEIVMNTSSCEDAIHFVRVEGSGVSVDLFDARADGVDADFSAIDFLHINVVNAGNDCIDLSQGKYKFEKVLLAKCGDKGVSAGEDAVVELGNVNVNQAVIGVAAKDGAQVNIWKGGLSNTKVGIARYLKKRNYQKPSLIFTDLECPGCSFFTQAELLMLEGLQ